MKSSLEFYQQRLKQAGRSTITSEVEAAGEFYYAEEYHQQYLEKIHQAIVDWAVLEYLVQDFFKKVV